MSTEEQMAAIGRLSMERTQAKREKALLESEIERFREKLSQAHLGLAYLSDPKRAASVFSDVEGLIASGSLERLRTALAELKAASQRAADITQTLKNAGAED